MTPTESSPLFGEVVRDPRLADVPTVYELLDEIKAPETIKKLANLLIASNGFGRPYLLPPATPKS